MNNHYSKNLIRRILLPIVLSLCFILIVGILAFQIQYQQGINNLANERMKYVEGQFMEELKHKSKILTGLLGLMKKNVWIGEYLSREDKNRLLTESRERLEQVRDVLGINHLYFSNINRMNILRVHNPAHSRDVIERFTMLEAERTGEIFSGLELGSMGTFTLRAVAPWEYRKKRVGYVELGMDASLILNEVAKQSKTGLILAISKSALKRQTWEERQIFLGRKPDWNKYHVHIISSTHELSKIQLLNIPELSDIENPTDNISIMQKFDNKTFVWRKIIINDVEGQTLGTIYLSINITDWLKNYKNIGLLTLIIYLIISIILVFTLYKLARRTQKAEAELQLTKDQFENLASYDQLVQLPNRQLFNKELGSRIKEAKRFNQNIAVIFIDLDNFKNINDTLGHAEGDILLQQTSRRISQLIRQYDVLARFGGDEFVLMMPNIDSESDIMIIMDKIIQEMVKPVKLNKEIAQISVSMGISLFPDDADNLDELLRYADIAMYEAKGAGKNNYRFYTRKK